MVWWLVGGAIVAVGAWCLFTRRAPGLSDVNPAFGMPMAGDPIYGAQESSAFGMAMYGGFNDSHLAPRGYFKPNMLEGE